ncbi:MAG TPA: sigma-70 family RNA polymerase sigma factor [Phycisphaerae bacterium]|nr:sigma-70 family RNA polymerase sigma factor [Phycisphaerae bacterium]HNU45157.1 sigma-70 family RNA polymerase sigma factor [Phycisphaerae bacterium]
MNTTRLSLLERVRDLDDASGWAQFDKLYRPLLMLYARRRGLSPADAEEIAQECLEVLVAKIQGFERRLSFRAWLHRIVDHKVNQHLARQRRALSLGPEWLEEAPATEPSPAQIWEQQWDRTHLFYCLAALRSDFAPHTLQAFELYVLQGLPVAEIARLLGMTPNQIYVAKSRVMRRLREAYRRLIDKLYGASR